MAAEIKHIHVLKRAGEADILLSFQTRVGTTDGLFQWNGTGWTLILALPGTDLIYDSTTFLGRMYWVDGKNVISMYDPDTSTVCAVTVISGTAPVGQYILVYQDRLIVGGDARTQAEVIAAGGVWPADSNRDRVVFCEALDDSQWTPNNYIDCTTGTGEVISGLGINSISSAIKGAQTQLVVFKPTAVMINDGALGSADQKLDAVSVAIGCPGYHSITNTPFGLLFISKETVCLLDTSGKEPAQPGVYISPAIKLCPFVMQKWSAGIFHDQMFKMSIDNGSGAASTSFPGKNNSEWWMDQRPQVFPNEQNWYGPHSGDFILQYALFNDGTSDLLIGAQMGTTTMWKLDIEGQWGSMNAPNTARTSVMIWPRLRATNQRKAELDAYGITGVINASVALTGSVDIDRQTQQITSTWTAPASLSSGKPLYALFRPARYEAHDAQVTISHSHASEIIVDSLYARPLQRQRQAEKQRNSTQT